MSETLRALWMEVRVIPVLLWSFSALTLCTALAASGQPPQVWYYLGAFGLVGLAGAVLYTLPLVLAVAVLIGFETRMAVAPAQTPAA